MSCNQAVVGPLRLQTRSSARAGDNERRISRNERSGLPSWEHAAWIVPECAGPPGRGSAPSSARLSMRSTRLVARDGSLPRLSERWPSPCRYGCRTRPRPKWAWSRPSATSTSTRSSYGCSARKRRRSCASPGCSSTIATRPRTWCRKRSSGSPAARTRFVIPRRRRRTCVRSCSTSRATTTGAASSHFGSTCRPTTKPRSRTRSRCGRISNASSTRCVSFRTVSATASCCVTTTSSESTTSRRRSVSRATR